MLYAVYQEIHGCCMLCVKKYMGVVCCVLTKKYRDVVCCVLRNTGMLYAVY